MVKAHPLWQIPTARVVQVTVEFPLRYTITNNELTNNI